MSDITLNEQGLKKLLSNINPHKASGPDGIHAKILKECKDQIAQILFIIFNKSLSEGKLPNDWKHANVCPLFKKGDKHYAINYRLIKKANQLLGFLRRNLKTRGPKGPWVAYLRKM